MRCLLDKNIVRYTLTALRDGDYRPLTVWEREALSFWYFAQNNSSELFISPATFHTLERYEQYLPLRIFLQSTQVLRPTKYRARWARRIRDTTGLAREDASMVALASFGTDELHAVLGVKWLVTNDQPLINGFLNYRPRLERRLDAMKPQLPTPYNQVMLPLLGKPDEVEISLKNLL